MELHCDIVPRTCENFLALCDMGYYANTLFHRSIRNFMVQVRGCTHRRHTFTLDVCRFPALPCIV